MKGATHFIEQYRFMDSKENESFFNPITEIGLLRSRLAMAYSHGAITVAIFLIKPKTPTNEH